METPLIHEHQTAGARLGQFSDCVLPEAFSDFHSEYAAARERVALFDTSWHAIASLSGRDRARYLHAITSNHISGLQEGSGTLALLLSPQGRILAELEVYARHESLLVRFHASARAPTLATLRKYIIRDDVQVEDWTDQYGSMAVEGPRAAAILEQACGLELEQLSGMAIREVRVQEIPCLILCRSHFGEPGAEFLARREWLPLLWKKLLSATRAQGGLPIGLAALNALRLEAGRPWFPLDFNDGFIPHEAAITDTHVSFNKGCYTGQEIVERVRARGQVQKKRVLLKFSTAEPPVPGTHLLAGGGETGYVTSAAYSPREGSAIGMGYVRREQHAPGSVLEFSDGTAVVL